MGGGKREEWRVGEGRVEGGREGGGRKGGRRERRGSSSAIGNVELCASSI